MARDPFAHPERTIRQLYAYVAYRVGSGPDAEDIVSESFERALRYRSSYDDRRGSPTAWLTGIARRVIADRGREQASRAGDSDALENLQEPSDFSEQSLQTLQLRWGMERLDERSRELLALRYGADLKAREIGDLLELRPNAVEVALGRALERLRVILETGNEPPEPTERGPGLDGPE